MVWSSLPLIPSTRSALVALLIVSATVSLCGCAKLAYYGQAVSGQWQLLQSRRAVEDVLSDADTSPKLRQRLQIAWALRDFASTELALPDNGSYRDYADLQRAFVVRNVFVTPPLSLEPHQWCFPLVGCVTYRGYFNADAAERFAKTLRDQGNDVYVANVPAYSTLGWFDDPLLNTFVYWPIGRLAELMFHELAHQRLFIPNDTIFNESFATAVGRLGAQLWLVRHGTQADRENYELQQHRRETFLKLVLSTRDVLAELYNSSASNADKQAGKYRELRQLKARYQALKQTVWNGYAGYDAWFNEDLNNAKLAALGAYTDYEPAFRKLFEQSRGDFSTFYRAAEALGGLPPEVREQRLQALLAS
ncbi:MAG: aminopeptidase [Candidatus Competibacteraceae bacterium]|jgi:predicted aminopeptidase|nr:aminopeptidase [Candidatus Competibacteraceae bacterium]